MKLLATGKYTFAAFFELTKVHIDREYPLRGSDWAEKVRGVHRVKIVGKKCNKKAKNTKGNGNCRIDKSEADKYVAKVL